MVDDDVKYRIVCVCVCAVRVANTTIVRFYQRPLDGSELTFVRLIWALFNYDVDFGGISPESNWWRSFCFGCDPNSLETKLVSKGEHTRMAITFHDFCVVSERTNAMRSDAHNIHSLLFQIAHFFSHRARVVAIVFFYSHNDLPNCLPILFIILVIRE